MKRLAHSLLRRFSVSNSGATAVIYALTLLPLILLIGFAVDARRAVSAKSHMQSALDAAVLSGALDYSRDRFLPEAERFANADRRFRAAFDADIQGVDGLLSGVNLTLDKVGEEGLQGTASGRLPLIFGGLFGRNQIDLDLTSSAEAVEAQRVEIVLALDNTTSMFRQNRFNLMRSAAKGFVNDLFDQADVPGLTAIGVVPWATLVNINSERPSGFDPGPAAARSVGADGRRVVPSPPFQDRLRYLLAPEDDRIYSRDELERDFAPVGWRGCVRAAPGEREVSFGGSVRGRLTDRAVPGMRWHAAFLEPELTTVRGGDDDDGDDDDDDDDNSGSRKAACQRI
ncbi:MAG: pilus assembly protein TadG-related protein, partial [Pseudomonadota bacterium]